MSDELRADYGSDDIKRILRWEPFTGTEKITHVSVWSAQSGEILMPFTELPPANEES